MLNQPVDDLLALGILGVDGDRALVAVEHREIEAVRAFDVAQLPARDVADARPLDFDHVRPHITEQLGAGRARLHVCEVEHTHAVERLASLAIGPAARTRQAIAVFPRRGLLGRLLDGGPFRGALRPALRLHLLLFPARRHRSSPKSSFTLQVGGTVGLRRARSFLFQRALRVEIADAAALATGGRIDDCIDQGRLAAVHRRVYGAL